MINLRLSVLPLLLALAACASVPAPAAYDPSCFAQTLPMGVAYPTPRDGLDALFPRHELDGYPTRADDAFEIVTLRRTGPYSEPEVQVTLFASANGSVRAELIQPSGCSVSDQLYAAFVADPRSSEAERLRKVKLERKTVDSIQEPDLARAFRAFQHLHVATDRFAGLVLDVRSYHVRVETALEYLEFTAVIPDRRFQI